MKLFLALALLGCALLNAAPILFSGTVNGTFIANGQSSYSGMTYTNKTFSGSTDASGSMTIDLGNLVAASHSSYYAGVDALKITVAFDIPSDTPVETDMFTANLYNGGWNGFWQGAMDIWLSPINAIPITFTNAAGTTTANIKLVGGTNSGDFENGRGNIPYVYAAGGQELYAQITNAQFTPAPSSVPEPSTMFLAIGAALVILSKKRWMRT